MKDFWLKEFSACCSDSNAGFFGFCQSQNALHYPPSDPVWDPFYKISIEAGAPVLLMTGLTGIGQGMPGGKGVVLEDGHPRHVDHRRRALSGIENPRRPAGLAVAGRHDRGAAAQGQCRITKCMAGRRNISRRR